MAEDHSLEFRRAVVTALNADVAVAALVSKAYGPVVPAGRQYDFIRVDKIDPIPFEATCLEGSEFVFDVHGFTKADDEGPCRTLAKAINDALDDTKLTFSGAHTIALDWVRSQFVRDTDEADVWHGIVTFEAQTANDF